MLQEHSLTCPLMYMYSVIDRLMLIVFEQICVKLTFFYFALTGVKD